MKTRIVCCPRHWHLRPTVYNGSIAISDIMVKTVENLSTQRHRVTACPPDSSDSGIGKRGLVRRASHRLSKATSHIHTKLDERSKGGEEGSDSGQEGGSRFSKPLTYLRSNTRELRARQAYPIEHIVCFPGYASLKLSKHGRDGDIHIFVSGYCYRSRGENASLTVTQETMLSSLRRYTGLPSLNSTGYSDGKGSEVDAFNADEVEQALEQTELMDTDPTSGGDSDLIFHDAEEQTFATMIDMGEEEDFDEPDDAEEQTSATRIKMEEEDLDATSPTGQEVEPARPSMSSSNSLTRPSLKSSHSSRRTLKRQGSFNELDSDELCKLHQNMKHRAEGFLGRKVGGRQVQIEIWPVEEADEGRNRHHHNHHSNHSTGPLYTHVVTTNPGGGWSLEAILTRHQVAGHGKSSAGRMKLRVEVKLLKLEGAVGAINTFVGAVASVAQKSEPITSDEFRTSTTIVEVTPTNANQVHLFSDIDDTIKKTEVLAGVRAVLRNVFLRSTGEVVIQGMAEWYKVMVENGCSIHYVSNSPFQLWGPIQEYLKNAKFPDGSVSLREYSKKVKSVVVSDVTTQKAPRIEAIMNEFPNSKIICVGDSGEKDLEVYLSLALKCPGQIIAIYLRDVTTTPSEQQQSQSEPKLRKADSIVKKAQEKSQEFVQRFKQAKSQLPDDVILQLFHTGEECVDGALAVMRSIRTLPVEE